MGRIHIGLPESVLVAAGQSREEFIQEARLLLALKLFKSGHLSSGRAAEICEMPRTEFLLRAGQAGIPIADLEAEELDQEFADA